MPGITRTAWKHQQGAPEQDQSSNQASHPFPLSHDPERTPSVGATLV
jgi:hypothetical protein